MTRLLASDAATAFAVLALTAAFVRRGLTVIGESVSHYPIITKLGGGGMGVVYEAEDLNLGRKVALKFLPDARETPEAPERFKREARAASALNHPHICVIHDLGEHEGKAFIAMERMKGETLKHVLTKGPMPLEREVALGSQIADALEAAHGPPPPASPLEL